MNNKILVLVGFVILIIILVGGGYFFYQVSLNQQAVSVQTPPITPAPPKPPIDEPQIPQIKLNITSPIPNARVTTSQISVKGQTVPLADVVVNDTETKADATGNFSVTINLEEGENPILVVVSDANGNYSEREIIVTYEK